MQKYSKMVDHKRTSSAKTKRDPQKRDLALEEMQQSMSYPFY